MAEVAGCKAHMLNHLRPNSCTKLQSWVDLDWAAVEAAVAVFVKDASVTVDDAYKIIDIILGTGPTINQTMSPDACKRKLLECPDVTEELLHKCTALNINWAALFTALSQYGNCLPQIIALIQAIFVATPTPPLPPVVPGALKTEERAAG